MSYPKRSRLKRKLENQTRIQILFLTIGIILLLFLVNKYGIIAITTVGKVFTKVNELKGSSKNTLDSNNNEILLPPQLNPIVSATNSAMLNISGNSLGQNGKILLYLNSNLKFESSIDKNGDFKFNNINLEEGDNFIKVKFQGTNKKTSDFSTEYDVVYTKKNPSLDINYPSDRATFSKSDQTINIQGKTDPDNTVLVNGFIAIVDGSGYFSYYFKLQNGDNNIEVIATDPAGNITTKKIKVTYNQ